MCNCRSYDQPWYASILPHINNVLFYKYITAFSPAAETSRRSYGKDDVHAHVHKCQLSLNRNGLLLQNIDRKCKRIKKLIPVTGRLMTTTIFFACIASLLKFCLLLLFNRMQQLISLTPSNVLVTTVYIPMYVLPTHAYVYIMCVEVQIGCRDFVLHSILQMFIIPKLVFQHSICMLQV